MISQQKLLRGKRLPRFTLVIPVYNGGTLLLKAFESICSQDALPAEILILNSESTDDAISQIERHRKKIQPIQLKIISISKQSFDHGGTRNLGLRSAKHPFVLFMTQDAICASPHTFRKLLEAIVTTNASAAYGRQLPHADANPIAMQTRQFNYPSKSQNKSMRNASELGIKTWFISNSFSVWNRLKLLDHSGFSEHLIFGEDMHAAARMIQGGENIFYCAEAQVYHSHNYTLRQEFSRYFDIGVFHRKHEKLLFAAGNPESEGLRFVLQQFLWLLKNGYIFSALKSPFVTLAKFIGYRLGKKYLSLPRRVILWCSMNQNYWKLNDRPN